MCLSSIFDLGNINVAEGRKTIAVTHDKKFHADDVFTGALLKIALGEDNVEIRRTRDAADVLSADIIFDMGMKYDGFKYFDHHQDDARLYMYDSYDSPKHCAFTLIAKAIFNDDDLYERFMNTLGIGIAIRDNSQTELLGKYSSLGTWVKYFNSTFYEDCDDDFNYEIAINIAKTLITRVIKNIEAWQMTNRELQSVANVSDKILILDKYIPFEDYISENYPDILMAIYPSVDRNEWFLSSIPKHKGDYNTYKIYFPVKWRGYNAKYNCNINDFDKDLEGCKFVSFRGYHSAWKSKDSAVRASEKVLEYQFQ